MATEEFLQQIIERTRLYASNAGNNAIARGNRAIDVLSQLQFQPPEIQPLQVTKAIRYALEGGVREIDPGEVEAVFKELDPIDLPRLKTPSLSGLNGLNLGTPPRINATVGNHPRPTIADRFTGTRPTVDTNIDFPVKPDVEFPERSELLQVTIPEPPVIDIPDYRVTPPEFRGTIPEDTAQHYIDTFRTMCGDLEDKIDDRLCRTLKELFPNMQFQNQKLDEYLQDFLCGNRSAFDDCIEKQIYVRVQNRVDYQRMQQEDETRELARETSNPIMPLRVRSGLLRVAESSAAQLTEHATATAEQRAQREVEHYRIVIGHVMQLRELAINTRNQEQTQQIALANVALEFSEKSVDLLYREFSAWIQLYEAEITQYQAQLAELESLREYALTELEVWKQRLEGERIKSEINQNLVRQDQLGIQYIEAVLSAYETELQAVRTEVELRKLPIDIYRAEVEAYAAYVSAIRGEVDIFEALVNADVARIQAEVSEVQAWVETKKIEALKIDIERYEIDAVAAYNRALIEKAELEFRQQQHLLDIERLKTEIRKIGIDADLEKLRLTEEINLEEFKTNNQIKLDKMELNMKYRDLYERLVQEYNRLLLARVEGVAGIHQSVAGVYGSIGAAALNGINTLVSTSNNRNEEG